jgi:hypothetical protein
VRGFLLPGRPIPTRIAPMLLLPPVVVSSADGTIAATITALLVVTSAPIVRSTATTAGTPVAIPAAAATPASWAGTGTWRSASDTSTNSNGAGTTAAVFSMPNR